MTCLAKGRANVPSAKRRKTTKASTGETTSKAPNAFRAQRRYKAQQDLSIALTMPLDVVFEVILLSPLVAFH